MAVVRTRDHVVCPEGFINSIQLEPPGTFFTDDEYVRRVWSGHPLFGLDALADGVEPLADEAEGSSEVDSDATDMKPMGPNSSDEENPTGPNFSDEEDPAIHDALVAGLEFGEHVNLADMAAAVEHAAAGSISPSAISSDSESGQYS